MKSVVNSLQRPTGLNLQELGVLGRDGNARVQNQGRSICCGLLSERVDPDLECEWLHLHESILPHPGATLQRAPFGSAATKMELSTPFLKENGPLPSILNLYILV